jgi:hypothetical protein
VGEREFRRQIFDIDTGLDSDEEEVKMNPSEKGGNLFE